MDGSSTEGTPIHITEASSQSSDVILIQAKLTGLAEKNAKTGASCQSPIPDHSQDPQGKAATLQLPVQSPGIHRPDNEPSLDSTGKYGIVSPTQNPDGRIEQSLGEFQGSFMLRPSKKQEIQLSASVPHTVATVIQQHYNI